MQLRHQSRTIATIHRVRAGLAAIGLVCAMVISGLLTMATTVAADYNHNAIGYINSCSLDSGGHTIIHGWAHDPEAPHSADPRVEITAGTTTHTVNTDVSGYYDAQINHYLSANYPNMPQGAEYGFSVSFYSLYKGRAYQVSGRALNYGTAGDTTSLRLDSMGGNGDAINAGTLLNANGTLPDACLATAPAPPPAPTTPTPTPPSSTPSPTPSPDPGDDGDDGGSDDAGSGNDDDSSDSTDTSAGGQDTHNPPADGTVATGTLSAVVTAPADGATSIYILYGTDQDNLDGSTDDVSVSGDSAEVPLTDLQANTKYYYQIVRTDGSGTITNSPVGSFQTVGYAITLHFIDSGKKPVSGVAGLLNNSDKTSTKSDKNGDLKFYSLDDGSYTVKYQYKKMVYSKVFDTATAAGDDSSNGKTVVLKDTVNVSTLKGGAVGSVSTKKHSSVGVVLFILFLILLLVGLAIWFVLRRRKKQAALYATYGTTYASNPSSPAGPGVIDMPTSQVTPVAPAVPAPAIVKPAKVSKKAAKNAAAEPEPLEHVGESLREMVIRSMHEETQKRKDSGSGPGPSQTPQPPTT